MTSLELLVAQFPGKTFIPMVEAGGAIGYATQTCYNLYHAKRFPLPVRKLGSKCMVALLDLANYMDGNQIELAPAPDTVTPAKRRPGRPSKRDMIEGRA